MQRSSVARATINAILESMESIEKKVLENEAKISEIELAFSQISNELELLKQLFQEGGLSD